MELDGGGAGGVGWNACYVSSDLSDKTNGAGEKAQVCQMGRTKQELRHARHAELRRERLIGGFYRLVSFPTRGVDTVLVYKAG